ncbi:uncharacterized protein LOC118435717 [Folsomia candida]|nr:uncharacterized protein LOC118435717 [Folsomia candida]
MIIFMLLSETALCVVPLLQLIMLTYAPCTLPFILSMDPNCKAMIASKKGVHLPFLGIHLFETWLWFNIMNSSALWIIYVFFSGIMSILTYFRVLLSQISIVKTPSDLHSCIKLYKSIQILEKYFNAFLLPRVIPVLITGVPILQIISLYVCLNHNQDIDMPGFLVFPLLLMEAAGTIIFVFTLASKINNSSETMVKFLKDGIRKGSGNKAHLKKEIKSLSLLKIKFGSNFIDRGTPLVIETFCINQTVSLTLIKHGKMGG